MAEAEGPQWPDRVAKLRSRFRTEGLSDEEAAQALTRTAGHVGHAAKLIAHQLQHGDLGGAAGGGADTSALSLAPAGAPPPSPAMPASPVPAHEEWAAVMQRVEQRPAAQTVSRQPPADQAFPSPASEAPMPAAGQGAAGGGAAAFQAAAAAGDPDAQFNLGVCYADGIGVLAAPQTAVQWWTKAAESEHGEALHALSQCFRSGRGVSAPDEARALACCRAAATFGSSAAQCRLGVRMLEGQGVPRDEADGAKWLELAARQGARRHNRYDRYRPAET